MTARARARIAGKAADCRGETGNIRLPLDGIAYLGGAFRALRE
ncbi:MAG: hypothetical protein ACLRSW_11110 [Christensenellaceae bacterium]